jgi:hypothetical protein
MPARIVTTDPFRQIGEYVGSGPMRFIKDEWVPGAKAVFERFAAPPAGPGREREPCRSVAGRLHQLLVALFAAAFQFPDDGLPPDLVLFAINASRW